MEQAVEILIPFIVFSSLLVLIWLLLLYGHKKKVLFLTAIEDALKSNPQLSPDVIREIGAQFFSSHKDLRKGVILIAVSLSIAGFSLLADFKSGNDFLNKALLGLALFPGFTGVAFLLMHKFNLNN